MAADIVEDFEAGLTGWSLVKSGSVDATTGAAAVHKGATGLIIDSTGGAETQYIQKTIATKTWTYRLHLYVATRPAASNNVFTCLNANGDAKIILRSTGELRAQMGAGTTQTSAVLNTGQWYLLEVSIDASGSGTITATLDWRIDSVAQTQVSQSQTSANFTAVRLGIQGSTTTKFYVDSFYSDTSTAVYPLGPDAVNAAAVTATGTGAATTGIKAEAPNAGTGSGTGAANAAVPKFGSQAGSPSGTGAAYTPTQTTSASIGTASGTGSGYDVPVKFGVPAGSPSGTGLALQALGTSGTAAGNASGTGTASAPAPSVAVSGGSASGTGATYTAVGAELLLYVETPEGSGEAYDGTTQASQSLFVDADVVIDGTGEAFDMTANFSASSESAAGTGDGYDATITTVATVRGTATLSDGTLMLATVSDALAP